MDSRFLKLADLLVRHSTHVMPGDVVIIECFDIPQLMIEALVASVQLAGGHPIVWQKSWMTLRAILLQATAREIDVIAEAELQQMRQASAYISLRAPDNALELRDVPEDKMTLFQANWLGKVHYQYRVHHTKWCSGKWPTPALAQSAGMSTRDFEKFFFQACVEVDYGKMSIAMDPLVDLIQRTDRVRVTAPDTDVSFSIKGIGARKCAGDCNLPDGEVFTAPVKESVNGYIAYNTPSIYQGRTYDGISLSFRNGRIVSAHCRLGNPRSLETVLDTDEGSRYVGEFAFGVNPVITRTVGDTMFDEKMSGSIHLTPGNSYKAAFNGNQSGIHWDLVLDQTANSGGGDIYFDDVLIRRDGIFLLPELADLNPTSLTV